MPNQHTWKGQLTEAFAQLSVSCTCFLGLPFNVKLSQASGICMSCFTPDDHTCLFSIGHLEERCLALNLR